MIRNAKIWYIVNGTHNNTTDTHTHTHSKTKNKAEIIIHEITRKQWYRNEKRKLPCENTGVGIYVHGANIVEAAIY